MLEGEVTLWDVPDVLTELHTNWLDIVVLLRVPGNSGVPDTLDIVLCGDPSVSLRLHALSLVFRARMYSLMFSNLFCRGGCYIHLSMKFGLIVVVFSGGGAIICTSQ